MEERISTIKKLELKNDFVENMIMFDRIGDVKILEEFDFYKEDADKFVASYKNVGIVFRLGKVDDELQKDWKNFIGKVIKKSYEFDKFNNVFLNKTYDKILLVTNKRLLNVDLAKLNEKIEEINYRIESYDEKVYEEMEDLAEATKDEKGFFSKVIEVLKK